jgi:chemotaxis protein CheX
MSSRAEMAAANQSSFPEAWREILRNATTEVFSMMAGIQLGTPGEADPAVQTELTGMVGLAGQLCGMFSIRCTARSANKIASHMLGVADSEAASHQTDALGEICNMVAGNFKAKIDGLQDKCMLSVPTVIRGSDYQLYPLGFGERIDLPFLLEEDAIWITLEVRS